MHIAQVSATFPPYMAGTGNVCLNNSVGLARRGHKVTVLTREYTTGSYDDPENIRVIRYKPLFEIGNAPFIPELMRTKGYDIVHLHYPFYFGGEMMYLLSKLKKIRYVVTYHNDVRVENRLNNAIILHEKTIMRKILLNARKVCFHSMDFASHSSIHRLVDDHPGAIEIIPNGVDTGRFTPGLSADEVKKAHELKEMQVILFVGSLDKAHYFKGVDVLLNSFAGIRSKNYRLVLVGEGDMKPDYISRARELGVLDQTVFAGRVPENDLPYYYAAADLVVLPSVAIESFGMVLIEAMACGKPVIASDIPGVRTVVEDEVDGFLTRPGDEKDLGCKIRYLLDNEETCRRFGMNGRRKVERMYTWETIAERLEACYLRCLD
jgi:glycosyltransferase involved in cell wall biosynthesis